MWKTCEKRLEKDVWKIMWKIMGFAHSCLGLFFSFLQVPAEIFQTLAFERRGVFSCDSFVQVEGCSDTHSEFSSGRAECRIRRVLAGLNKLGSFTASRDA